MLQKVLQHFGEDKVDIKVPIVHGKELILIMDSMYLLRNHCKVLLSIIQVCCLCIIPTLLYAVPVSQKNRGIMAGNRSGRYKNENVTDKSGALKYSYL